MPGSTPPPHYQDRQPGARVKMDPRPEVGPRERPSGRLEGGGRPRHRRRHLNTTSVTAYEGNPSLLDYSATKGAIAALTRALSQGLADRGIRLNAVAPGPIWTP